MIQIINKINLFVPHCLTSFLLFHEEDAVPGQSEVPPGPEEKE